MRNLLQVALAMAVVPALLPAQSVLTGNYDNSRTNANLSETVLSPATVKPGSFGKLFSLSVDGQIYAQPLYLQNVTVSGKGIHNVLYVCTMHNTVYAFDADTPGVPLWSVNLGPAVPTANYTSDDGQYTDITPENGILGTPVIDPASGTLYVVAATFETGKYLYRLHALDTGSGAEKYGAPSLIHATVAGTGDGSVNGNIALDPAQHLQRPGLLLLNNVVYVSFGSHGDAVPFHGWMLGYNAHNVQSQLATFNATPNGGGGSFWQSGRAPAADASGNIYAVSSNGDTDETRNYGDNVLRLDAKTLAVKDWFAPFNFQFLNDTDDDLGACGAVLIDGTNFLVTGGKQGVFYLLNKSNFGHVSANDGQILQSVDTQAPGIFNMALWNRPDGPRLYLHTINSGVTVYKLVGNQFTTTPVARSFSGFAVPFQGMALSANGVVPGSGILWVLATNTYPLPAHAILHAYNADTLAEIWNSDMLAADSAGNWMKFVNPTVVNGKVYVPTASNQVVVYGTGGNFTQTAPTVTGVVNAASYANAPLAPGEIVAILGSNLGPVDLALGSFDKNGVLCSHLGGTQVTFNGVPGPLVYSSATAVAAIVPYEVSGAKSISVQVLYNGQNSPTIAMTGGTATPGIFTADASGSGPAAVLNADYSLNTPTHPAKAGSIVVLYATGGGQTKPAATTGSLTTQAASLASDVHVSVGGQTATILYAGNAGGEVAGALQLNVRLPSSIKGTQPVVMTVGGVSSQATATVSIQ